MVAKTILSSYDVLLVDLYGVIWSGTHGFPEALGALESLITEKKDVIILSNASSISAEMTKKYDAGNLRSGVHFTHFVTSGDVLRSMFLAGNFPFATSDVPKKYSVLGMQDNSIFAGTGLEYTSNLDEADFVYLAMPRFSDAEREEIGDDLKKFLFVARGSGPRAWDSTDIAPYMPKLRLFLEKGKTLVMANPDKFAMCQVLETPDATEYVPKLIAKQGLIGEAYENMGGKIFATGKPSAQIYRYGLEKLVTDSVTFEDVCKKSIAMVGDTLETDILGAINATKDIGAKIDSILVLSGISAGEMGAEGQMNGANIGDAMEKFFAKKKIRPTHVLSALDLGAATYF